VPHIGATGLPFSVDFPAVKSQAPLLVTEDFMGGGQLGELRRLAWIVVVGIGMQLLG